MPLFSTPSVKRIVFALLLLAATVFAGRKFPAQPDESTVPDEVIVRLRPGADPHGPLNRIVHGGASVRLHGRANLYKLHLPAAVTDALLDRFASDPDVVFVEPNRLRSTTGIVGPSDSSYSSQWALTNIRALRAWGVIPAVYFTSSTFGSRIKVAHLDTGADCTHPDFVNAGGSSVYSNAGGQLSQSLSQAYFTTTISGPACPWQDDHGHGTHTAGTIAAATNNAAGVASLGYGLELIIYKVLDAGGNGDDATIAAAIMSAADAGARVVSLSLGGAGYSQSMQDAVDYAWSKDTLVVAAAGNANSSALFFPADANHAIGVAATDATNSKASFSNFGPSVDIAAPGLSVLSTYPTYLGSHTGYTTMSGTSMATPHVAALAGLVAATTPGIATQGISQRIQQSAASTTSGGGWTSTLGYGVIDAFGALSGASRPATTGSVVGQMVDSTHIPVSGTITLGPNTITVNSTGLFRISGLAPGTYTLSATGAPGTQSLSVAVVPGADTTVTVPLGVSLGIINGRVLTASAAALGGAVVQAISGGVVSGDAVSDASGQYSLSVPPGTYDLRVTAPGYDAATVSGFTVSAASSQVADLTIGRLGRITGQVVDQTGTPIAGADILVQGLAFSAGATTGADGTYSTPGLPAGSYNVSASNAGVTSATSAVGIADDADGTASFALQQVIVSVSPSGGTLVQSQQRQFTATVTGTADQGVTWTRSPAVGTISSAGLYTAPATVTTPTTVTITATSVAAPSRSASTNVTVTNLFTLTLSPTSVVGGASAASNKITLDTAAPAGGAQVTLASSNPSLASVPAFVTVAAGATISPLFAITTSYVSASTVVSISATYQGSTKSVNLTLRPAAVSSVTLSPLTIGGGGTVTARVNLDGPAGPSGVTVGLSSSNTTLATLAASVLVPGGATSSSVFNVSTSPVAVSTQVTITASYAGVDRTATLTLNPIAAASVTLSPVILAGGKQSTANRVNLNGPAPSDGAVVSLTSSDTSSATVPPNVTVVAGATFANFTINSTPVTASRAVTITASYGGASPTASLTVRPPVLYSVTLSPATLVGGASSTANRVTLDAPAPSGGISVLVSSSNAAATPPANVTVQAGATYTAFTIASTSVNASTPVTITGTYAGVSKPATLTLVPLAASSVVPYPASVAGGTTSTSHRVNLNGTAPAGGAVVSLASSDSVTATVPATVSVAAGATYATFRITTAQVTVSTPVTITATYGGASPSGTLTVRPPMLISVLLSPATVTSGATTTVNRAYLDGPALPGGASIALSSNSGAATPAASVLIPAGATSAPFTITTTSGVSSASPVTITASYGSVSKTASLTVN